MSQPAISRRIQALEDDLGVSLFERQVGGVRVTRAGQAFLGDVARALQLLDEAVSAAGRAGRAEAGRLALGHAWPLGTAGLDRELGNYVREAGDVEVALREGDHDELLADLQARDLDLIFTLGGAPPPWVERLEMPETGWALVFGPQDPPPDTVDWSVLSLRPLLLAPTDPRSRFEAACQIAGGRRLDVRLVASGRDSHFALAAAGLGWTLAPVELARAWDAPYRPLPRDVCAARFWVAWLPGNDNPALRRFISRLRRLAPRAPPDCAELAETAAVA